MYPQCVLGGTVQNKLFLLAGVPNSPWFILCPFFPWGKQNQLLCLALLTLQHSKVMRKILENIYQVCLSNYEWFKNEKLFIIHTLINIVSCSE